MADRMRLSPEERREQILAATALLLADGRPVTVAAAASAASVAPTLVYHYFANRDGLVAAVADRERRLLLEVTAVDPALPAEQALRQAVTAYVDHIEAAGGDLRSVYVPGGDLRGDDPVNHDTQVDRILTALRLEATPKRVLAVGGWLAFVVQVATRRTPDVSRDEVIDLCCALLPDVARHAGSAPTVPPAP